MANGELPRTLRYVRDLMGEDQFQAHLDHALLISGIKKNTHNVRGTPHANSLAALMLDFGAVNQEARAYDERRQREALKAVDIPYSDGSPVPSYS